MPGFFGFQAPYKVLPTGIASSEHVLTTYSGFLSATSAAFLGSAVKQSDIPFTATSSSFSGSLSKLIKSILSAVFSAFNGSLVKKILVSLSAGTSALNGLVVKRFLKLLSSVSSAFSGSAVKKSIVSLIALSISFSGSVIKKSLVSLAALMTSFKGSIVKKISTVLFAISSALNGAVTKIRLLVLVLSAVMTALNGSTIKKISTLLFGKSASLSGAQSKKAFHGLSSTLSALSGRLNKFTKRFLKALSSAWSAIVEGVKQSTPLPPTPRKPMVVGNGIMLQSFGASFSNPISVSTTSNNLQTFKSGNNQYLNVGGSTSLFKKTSYFVAMGDVTIPASGLNTALNVVLTLKGFSQNTQPAVAIQDDVVAVMPSPSQIPVGTVSWQLICRVSGTQSGTSGFSGNKVGGHLQTDYVLKIGDDQFEGTLFSSNNPFLQGQLQFSLGVQFLGSVSGSDTFQANLYQFETQQ